MANRKPRMSLPTFFVEFLQRIGVAQVTLAGRFTVNFSFTKNAITCHSPTGNEPGGNAAAEGVQICCWCTPELNLRSCREMKLSPRDGLSMRFKITSDDTWRRGRGKVYSPTCPEFLVPKDELAEYGAEECWLNLRCGFCHSELTLKEK